VKRLDERTRSTWIVSCNATRFFCCYDRPRVLTPPRSFPYRRTMTASPSPSIVSVNVGAVAPLATARGNVPSGIVKRPVAGRVPLRGVNLAGDAQADLESHGGVDMAVYAYAAEDYRWWETELGRALEPGTFGENLTTAGIDVNAALVGERWRVGADVELEVSIPRIPCYKLAARMGDPTFVKRFGAALRPGPYLRVVREGTIGAGDPIAVIARPEHGLRIVDVTTIYLFERERAGELLAAPQIGASWTEWAEKQLAR
jgi:MOSC domain-containing protein YiiM